MRVSFPLFIASVVAVALPSAHASHPAPYQGVFTMSNDITNTIGVNQISADGSLQWVGAFETGGIGLGFGTIGRWTSTNIINYHVWNDQQWLVAANMGGLNYESSVSIFKVAPDLTLELTDVVDAIRSDSSVAWATSVAAYDDRACVFGGGDNLLLECFRISTEGKLSSDFYKDFNIAINPNITVSGASGTASVQFSPDGTKLAVLSKGSISSFFFEFGGVPLNPDAIAPAGLYIFPVESGDVRYGEPMVLEIDVYTRPYDLVWSPDSSNRLWTVGFPVTPTDPANIMTIDIDSSGVSEVGTAQFGPSFACWIEYLNGHLYTSNFVLFDDLTIFPVNDDGMANVTSARTQSIATDGNPANSGPFDFAFSGETGSGKRYMYVQLALSKEIGAFEMLDDGSMTEVGRYPIIGDWTWNSGAAATLLSQDELNELFSPKEPTPSPTVAPTPAPTPAPTAAPTPSPTSGASQTVLAFTSAFAAVVVPLLFN